MAKQDVKALLKQTRERRCAEVNLSTGETLYIYFVPLTEAEDEKIREAIEGDKKPNAYGYRVLINKAEHENGDKMFTKADIPMLRNEYAKADMTAIMEAIVFNGGVLASEDSKSNQGGDQE
jgi:hypothetical protein